MEGRIENEDETLADTTDSASGSDHVGETGLVDNGGGGRDDRVHRGTQARKGGNTGFSLEETKAAISGVPDAGRNIWRHGRERIGADSILKDKTRRPLPILLDVLADAEYYIEHTHLADRKAELLRRSLMASLKTCYGLAVLLEKQLKMVQKFRGPDDPRSKQLHHKRKYLSWKSLAKFPKQKLWP